MAAKGQVDLLDCIEFQSLECLNAKPGKPAANAIKQVMARGCAGDVQGYREDDGLLLESDVDEQLLLYIPFNQVVKLHSIIVKGPEDSGPKTLKLFVNRPSMGFSNVNDFPATDSLTFTPEQLKEGASLPLKYVKFQSVRSLTIFIENNQEDEDSTSVSKIVILGSTVETTNMKDLKKIEQGH